MIKAPEKTDPVKAESEGESEQAKCSCTCYCSDTDVVKSNNATQSQAAMQG
jgi:hypothetical protein